MIERTRLGSSLATVQVFILSTIENEPVRKTTKKGMLKCDQRTHVEKRNGEGNMIRVEK